jgi:hypothetical protein
MSSWRRCYKGKASKTTWQLLTVSKLCLGSFCLVFGLSLQNIKCFTCAVFRGLFSAHWQSNSMHIASFSSFRGVEPGTEVCDSEWSCPVCWFQMSSPTILRTVSILFQPWDRKMNIYFLQNKNNDIFKYKFFHYPHSGLPSADQRAERYDNFWTPILNFVLFIVSYA